ncbi:MAG: hypothetical protein VB958_02360 [Thalassolituus sp.]
MIRKDQEQANKIERMRTLGDEGLSSGRSFRRMAELKTAALEVRSDLA